MRFAISIPQFYADGEFDPEGFRAHVRRIEELGFDSGWTQEQVLAVKEFSHLGAIETMTYAAAVTERLRLGCSVFVTPLHNPVHLAHSLASLDQLSRGRLEVGVGSGGRDRPFAAFGVDPEGLISRFTEGLEIMRALWSQPSVTFEGRFWQLKDAKLKPGAFQKPGPPIWFGGAHPKALRRAARLADGFFGAGASTTAAFADQVRTLRTELASAHRDPTTFAIAKRVYIAIDDGNPDRARERISTALENLYGTPTLASVAVAGTTTDCIRGIQDVADAGAELILFTPLHDEADHMEHIAAEVIPQLR
ncbi:LLM class flavin-dependent oxidoreductase [Nocardia transvalensis]|uniref:LLM class flavin-dependent oxidoreductase n=1 Tax=Nocardia transvalensis TaxID=37333 RepID=UPI001892E6F8|nr:LLM class flavin-dependent oxidoreductase [Nocardia transvalensis]MBF6328172.1 LLM class flavin-dependent oxidoreductase [Nocardia transvalensis]